MCFLFLFSVVYCCCSVDKLCSPLCHPMDCSMPGLSVPYYLLEFAQMVYTWIFFMGMALWNKVIISYLLIICLSHWSCEKWISNVSSSIPWNKGTPAIPFSGSVRAREALSFSLTPCYTSSCQASLPAPDLLLLHNPSKPSMAPPLF